MISRERVEAIVKDGVITDDEVIEMRKGMYGDDHLISQEEADLLFQINDKCDGKCDTWPEFFVEAITDFVSRQQEPEGYVPQRSAEWFISKISASGLVKAQTEMEALLKVLDVSSSIPESLVDFTLGQVRHAVLENEGQTRSYDTLKPGQIGRAEVEILRVALSSFGGDGGLAVTRREAEILFDINDAVADTQNDPSWPDFFARSVANYLMASMGYQTPSREEALRREAWLDDVTTDVGGFLEKMASSLLDRVAGKVEDFEDIEQKSSFDNLASTEPVTASEADWVIERIQHDGKMTDAEKALLLFIKHNSPQVHSNLAPLIREVESSL